MKSLMITLLALAVSVMAQNDWQVSGVLNAAEAFVEFADDPALASSPVTLISLSPDGESLAGVSGETTCMLRLAAEDVVCFPLPDAVADQLDGSGFYSRMVWSPDSRFLAFTEDYYSTLQESDLWVLDTQSGAYTNRTDDGLTGRFMQLEAPEIAIDYQPTFASDNELYFFRATYTAEDGYTALNLMRLAPGEDIPEAVVDLTETLPGLKALGVSPVPALSPDDAQLAFAVYDYTDGSQSGVWIIDLTSGEVTQLIDADDLYSGLPESMHQRPLIPRNPVWAGSTGLVVQVYAGDFGGALPDSNYLYIDVGTGAVTPIVDLSDYPPPEESRTVGADGHSAVIRIPRDGAVSADGSAFIFLSHDLDPANAQLTMIALPPDDTEPLMKTESEYGAQRRTVTNPKMSADGKVLFGGWLYTLAQP